MNKTNMTFIKGNESLSTDELFQSKGGSADVRQ